MREKKNADPSFIIMIPNKLIVLAWRNCAYNGPSETMIQP